MLLIISCKSALLRHFGASGVNALAPVIDAYRTALSAKGIESDIVYLDESASTQAHGLQPSAVEPRSLAAKVREVIAALGGQGGKAVTEIFILGGPEIVPFLQVPNQIPTGTLRDPDPFILTDNHYGCAEDDNSYVCPTLPVGRLISPTSSVDSLVSNLQNAAVLHRNRPSRTGSIAIVNRRWMADSDAVAKTIGASVQTSPTYAIPPASGSDLSRRHIYVNLHGFQQEPKWCADGDKTVGLMFDVLTPQSFSGKQVAGSILFAENCYGAFVFEKNATNSCAVKAVSEGVAAFVGATGTSWGPTPFDPPGSLGNADRLAELFFEQVQQGETAGLALCNARQQYFRESVHNGEINALQYKTLLQFILLGDPTL